MAVLAKDVQNFRDQLMEREDEIQELKAERSNTRVSKLFFLYTVSVQDGNILLLYFLLSFCWSILNA